MDRLIYLDHAASAPLRPEVAEAMAPYVRDRFGNPSGSHQVARNARRALEEARDEVAAVLGAEPGEVVFTSGGTEADNLAVLGTLRAAPPGSAAVISAVEHPAVAAPGEAAAKGRTGNPVALRVAPVDGTGAVDLEGFDELLAADVALVSIMTANNEVGTIQPLTELIVRTRRLAPRARFHTDAVQAAPWLDLAPIVAEADLVSVSAHKLGGPKGSGALVVGRGADLEPLLYGGGQEREHRSGTQDVAGAVGLAMALRTAAAARDETKSRAGDLRDRLAQGLRDRVEGLRTTAPWNEVLPGHCHVVIRGVESEELLLLLDRAGVCASAGAACASGALEPSGVLAAMGVPGEEARGALRLSLGYTTTDADVEAALEIIPAAVERLRTPG